MRCSTFYHFFKFIHSHAQQFLSTKIAQRLWLQSWANCFTAPPSCKKGSSCQSSAVDNARLQSSRIVLNHQLYDALMWWCDGRIFMLAVFLATRCSCEMCHEWPETCAVSRCCVHWLGRIPDTRNFSHYTLRRWAILSSWRDNDNYWFFVPVVGARDIRRGVRRYDALHIFVYIRRHDYHLAIFDVWEVHKLYMDLPLCAVLPTLLFTRTDGKDLDPMCLPIARWRSRRQGPTPRYRRNCHLTRRVREQQQHGKHKALEKQLHQLLWIRKQLPLLMMMEAVRNWYSLSWY